MLAGDHEGLSGSSEGLFVTGLGPVCGFGLGADAFAGGLWEGLVYVPLSGSGGGGPRKARWVRAPEFDVADYVESRRPYMDPHSRLGLTAASLGLKSAGVEGEVPDPHRSGLATATVFGNMATHEAFQRLVRQKGVRLASPMLFPHSYPNATNSLLCVEFGLRGYNQNFCGGPLCGARALQTGFYALRSGLADLMLTGGCDAPTAPLAEVMTGEGAEEAGASISDGACFLVLETKDSMRRRGCEPLCEALSFVTGGTGLVNPEQDDAEARVAQAISDVIKAALKEGGMWEGDVGVIFLATRCAEGDLLHRACARALSGFSQVPTVSACEPLGETFAAGFALESTAAALVLSEGILPSPPTFQGVRKGVELWVEEEPGALVGNCALVLGWSSSCAAVAAFRAC